MSSRREEAVRASSRLRTAAKRSTTEEESDASGGNATSSVSDAPQRSRSSRSSSKKRQEGEQREEGCVVCKQDNDHANLMLCEACNGEYHIYCLNPPLESVPDGDWFCPKCRPNDGTDNLEELVNAMPVDYTSRFNDICWCQGGVGYGWWPACIFNPCKAIGAARSLAIKNLGKRHLVYFFDCSEAPFEIKADSAIMSWEMGLALGYHMGRTAYAHGKRRYKQFQMALQSACIEENVPKMSRLKWTFADEQSEPRSAATEKERPKTSRNSDDDYKPASNRDLSKEMEGAKPRRKRKRNNQTSDTDTASSRGRRARSGTNTEPSGQLVCEVIRRMEEDGADVPVGTVVLPSQKRATFADVRRYIKQELETLPVEWQWRFFVPGMGSLSMRQESKYGNMLAFMWRTAPSRSEVGDGTQLNPLRVILVDAPIVTFDEFD